MNSSNESRLSDLFSRAKDLSPDQQRHLAEVECDTEELKTELLGLLAAFNEAPRAEFANKLLPDDALIRSYEGALGGEASSLCGHSIGPYKVLELLGEGGMGAVYMAEQTSPVSRRVAVKLIKPGLDSKEVLARFEAERQALSMMDHPNIAKVLDAGSTDTRRPYFVMELVKGVPITQYCDNHSLSAMRRLELFIQVCQGVAHAHQKGIIHRDIKPSNVLIAEYDDVAIPKIIDFGVAKATTQRLTEETLFTRYGQLIGTIDYMSPEQAKLNQFDVDTRSDIYSLGVLLYELLSGSTPFDRSRMRSATINEALRIITEEEPPRPSLKLTRQDTASAIASRRGIEPRSLTRLLSGELDWIVMRALEKDRKHRYQVATDFARDIERYLAGEAVEAGPPSMAYRLRKFASRHRRPLGALATILLLLVVATTISVSLWRKAEKFAQQEQTQRRRAETLQEKAVAASQKAESALNLTAGLRLVSSESQRKNRPIRSLVMAIEAAELTQTNGGGVYPAAHEALLNAFAQVSGEPLEGHRGDFDRVAIGPNGESLVAACLDGTVRVWEIAQGQGVTLKHVLSGHQARVNTISFSPNGSLLATSSQDGAVRLWKLTSPSPSRDSIELSSMPGRLGDFPVLGFSPLGQWLTARGPEQHVDSNLVYPIHIWNVTAEDPASTQRVISHHQDSVLSCAISRDDRYLYSGSRDRTICVWDLSPPAGPTLVQKEKCSHYVTEVRISPDGKTLTSQYFGARPQLWSISADGQIFLQETLRSSYDLVFSKSGHWLAMAQKPNADDDFLGNRVILREWYADDDALTRDLQLPSSSVVQRPYLVGFSETDRWLLGFDWDTGTAILWDLERIHLRCSGIRNA